MTTSPKKLGLAWNLVDRMLIDLLPGRSPIEHCSTEEDLAMPPLRGNDVQHAQRA
jgi:hypothetical protein